MVLVLKTTPTMDRLRQMKRSLEENRKSEKLIEVTLYDEYRRMRTEYKHLKRVLGKDPVSSQIATAYDGMRHHTQDTVSQKVRLYSESPHILPKALTKTKRLLDLMYGFTPSKLSSVVSHQR